MKYRLLESEGEYAIERTFSVLGFTVRRERLDMRSGDFWWAEKQTAHYTEHCWSNDGQDVLCCFNRLTGEVKTLAEFAA